MLWLIVLAVAVYLAVQVGTTTTVIVVVTYLALLAFNRWAGPTLVVAPAVMPPVPRWAAVLVLLVIVPLGAWIFYHATQWVVTVALALAVLMIVFGPLVQPAWQLHNTSVFRVAGVALLVMSLGGLIADKVEANLPNAMTYLAVVKTPSKPNIPPYVPSSSTATPAPPTPPPGGGVQQKQQASTQPQKLQQGRGLTPPVQQQAAPFNPNECGPWTATADMAKFGPGITGVRTNCKR